MNTVKLTAIAKTRIYSSPQKVFAAFANADEMSKFWFTRRDNGLREGETVTWFVGEQPGAPRIHVRVMTLIRPSLIVMEWGDAEGFTSVTWTIEETSPNTAILRVEESGFTGTFQEIIDNALDSTGGFNQVIIAAKAFLEHGAVINVVADHVDSAPS